MVNREDQELYNYWAMKYDRLSSSLSHLEILYLITTRLRYENNIVSFLKFIASAMDTPSSVDIMHRNIFNIYYAAAKCATLGDPDIFYNFEDALAKYAHTHNQGRYWNKLRISYVDMSNAFHLVFSMDEYAHLNPASAESYKPLDPKITLKDEVDNKGNVIYY